MKITAAVVCLALAAAQQIGRDAAYPRTDPDTQKLLYVRSPDALKRIALGFDALAADVYWIRAIQHYGGSRLDRGARRYELLYPLLDITTSLDSYFNIAYRFGAIFLSEAYPGGPGRPDQAIELLRKGIAARPTKWEYYHDIAFVHYLVRRDASAASEWFKRAAEQPGAPNWLMPLAASVLTQGGERTSSRFLWQQILNSDQKWLRDRAHRGMKQLDALDQIDRLNALVAQTPKAADTPYTWAWFARARGFQGVPVDPAGSPYVLDAITGRVTISEKSLLFPLPKPMEPQR